MARKIKESTTSPNPGQLGQALTTPPTPPRVSHDHQWDLILKTYAQPKPEFVNETLSQEILEKLLFGATVLLWKCVLCTDSKKEEVIGTDENQLDDVFNKVIGFGPQYIQKEGNTFVIAKWQPNNQPVNNLPLR